MREALERLRRSLPRAGRLILPERYLQRVRVAVMVTLAVASLLAVGAFLALGAVTTPSVPLIAALALGVAILGVLAWLVGVHAPDAAAILRAGGIESKLPYAVNYLSTMSSGGLSIERMFAQMGVQDVYGPLAHEARLIHRDLTLLGQDVVAALRDAIDRSPSTKFQDFLQGLLTTVTSGGDLRLFLEAKSEQYFAENRSLQARFLDQLALLAEVFVVVAVAAPLVLLVLLSVLSVFGRSGSEVLVLGFTLVIVVLPVAHIAFAGTLRLLQPGR